jgi:predicted permease
MKKRFVLFPWRSRSQIARDVDAELAFHLEMRVSELVAGGLDADAARRRAQEEFGDIEFTRVYCRDVDARSNRQIRAADRLAGWRQDAQYAWRTLRRSPGFALISLLTLALAIGANTAIFSVTQAVLLRPLPYGAPGAVMSVFSSWPGHPFPAMKTPLSPPDFIDLRDQQHSFAGVAAFNPRSMTWRPASGEPQMVSSVDVSANLFNVLQVAPIHGRTFTPGDDAAGSVPRVVVSYRFWQRELGGDVARVGRPLILNGKSFEVIGVMPPSFTLWGNEDLWTPLDMSDDLAKATVTRHQHWIHAIARLKPGVTLAAANTDLAAIARRLASTYPTSDSGRTAFIIPMHDVISGNLRPALLLLLGGAGLVLLIACANLANVTLSRTTARRREIAVRAALGAGRGRIVRQLLIESTGVALVGGAIGVAIAAVATRILLALNPDALPGGFFVVAIDNWVLLYSLVLSLATGIAFGLIPALDAGRADLNAALRDGGRGSSGGRGGTQIRRTLVIAETGLAVMLLIGAGLLIRSFRDITNTPLGYEPLHVLTGQVRLSGERYDSEPAVNRFYDAALATLAHSPGVVAAGAASGVPTQGRVGTSLRIEGQSNDEANLPDIGYIGVHGDYFKAMNIPLLRGRVYDATDDATKPKVVIINDVAARRFFPRGDAIGHRIRIGPQLNAQWMTIVGIVGNIRDEGLDIPSEPALFANHRQEAWETSLTFVVRTSGNPQTAVPLLRRAVTSADPSVALRNILPLEQVLGSSLSARRFSLALLTGFSAVALLLAAIGIYGVLAYSVTSRTREFGVRLALGATKHSVLLLVLRQGLAWSLLGAVLGVGAAVAGGRLLGGMLYGVGPVDLTTDGAVIAGVLLVVAAACIVPAARATQVDPITSMRAE